MKYPVDEIREELSTKYITGSGIEIGALCHPLKVVDGISVKYVDRFDKAGLHKQYPDIPIEQMSEVDVIDDGEFLSEFDDDSQDFVIANHFLEHCADPLGTLNRWSEVVRSGGIIFCAIPDKTTSFDKDRPVTTLQHLLEDTFGLNDDFAHFIEVGGSEKEAQRIFDLDYSIHYHVWDKDALEEMLAEVCKMYPYKLLEFVFNPNRLEYIFILERL